MANPSADEFLNCVMKRGESDTIIRIGSTMLLLLGVPVVIMAIIGMLVSVFSFEWEKILISILQFSTGLTLFSSILDAFIVYMMVDSYYRHHLRDIEWMSSLSGYASSYGKDVSELKEIETTFASNKSKTVRLIAIAYFAYILVAHTVISVLLSANIINENFADEMAIVSTLSMTIEICLGSAYIFVCIRKEDNLQCGYTAKWSALMKDIIPEAKPMVTRIVNRRIWPHVILMIVTLSLYSFIFALWTVHTVNLHISRQNTYEESVLLWIKEKEGAKGIEGIDEQMGPGIVNMVRRMFA